MILTKLERWMLEDLGRSEQPLWGGHLKRGEPVNDPDMRRWIENGLIEAVGTEGYRLTDAGRAACGETTT